MDGIFPLLKPPGLTSNQMVSDVKHLLHEKKVGHLGTLDPGAAGVLPILVGKGTRLFDLLVDKEKEYIAEIAFGAETDTQDIYGTVTASSDAKVSAEQLSAVLPQFQGSIDQTAPAYSALKIDGKKLYELARSGREVPEKVRQIEVPELELIGAAAEENRFLIRIVCSRGTYIRTLCTDIGRAVGVPAAMSFLLRSRVGAIEVKDCLTLDEMRAALEDGSLTDRLISCEIALAKYPKLCIGADREKAAANGLPTRSKAADGIYRLYAGEKFLGTGNVISGEVKLVLHLLEEA